MGRLSTCNLFFSACTLTQPRYGYLETPSSHSRVLAMQAKPTPSFIPLPTHSALAASAWPSDHLYPCTTPQSGTSRTAPRSHISKHTSIVPLRGNKVAHPLMRRRMRRSDLCYSTIWARRLQIGRSCATRRCKPSSPRTRPQRALSATCSGSSRAAQRYGTSYAEKSSTRLGTHLSTTRVP